MEHLVYAVMGAIAVLAALLGFRTKSNASAIEDQVRSAMRAQGERFRQEANTKRSRAHDEAEAAKREAVNDYKRDRTAALHGDRRTELLRRIRRQRARNRRGSAQ